jgi:hypothetical protein
MQQAAEKTGREVGSYVLFMVIADMALQIININC